MSFGGSCHCGAVEFTVEGDIPAEAMGCNCSHCRRKGFLFSFVPAETFTLTKGEEVLTDYLFNKHAITHRFCSVCGCQPFAEGKGKDGETRAINLRCVADVDLDALKLNKVDGAAF
jgi:hypothetical protein